MGGDWHDLGGALSEDASEPVALQPLALIEAAAERGWAAEWISAILAREKISITPEVKDHLWSHYHRCLSADRRADPDRPLSAVAVVSLKRALQPYCLGGPTAGCSTPKVSARRGASTSVRNRRTDWHRRGCGVLAYLFHRIEGGSTAGRH